MWCRRISFLRLVRGLSLFTVTSHYWSHVTPEVVRELHLRKKFFSSLFCFEGPRKNSSVTAEYLSKKAAAQPGWAAGLLLAV